MERTNVEKEQAMIKINEEIKQKGNEESKRESEE